MSTNDNPSPTTVEENNEINDQFSTILSSLSQFKVQLSALTIQLRGLEKTVKREIKTHKKEVAKKQSKGNRKPSGFAAATPISDDLCDFLGKEHGTNMARTEVTKYICSYIKQNSLTVDDNNRVIRPDNKLKSLLGTNDETEITFFNIQRFMNKHFLKNKTLSVEDK